MVSCTQIAYKFFKAALIIDSTVASGSSATILSTTRSACFLLNPRTSKADNASSLFVLLVTAETSSMS